MQPVPQNTGHNLFDRLRLFWNPGHWADRLRGDSTCWGFPGACPSSHRHTWILAGPDLVVDQLQRSSFDERGGRRRSVLAVANLGVFAAGGRGSAFSAVPLPGYCRAGVHGLPVGHSSAGSRFFGNLPESPRSGGSVSFSVSPVSIHVFIWRCKAPEWGPYLARPYRLELPLRNPAFAHMDLVVHASAPGVVPEGIRGDDPGNRAGDTLPDIRAAAAAAIRRRLFRRPESTSLFNRKLHLLQSIGDCALPLFAGRLDNTPMASRTNYPTAKAASSSGKTRIFEKRCFDHPGHVPCFRGGIPDGWNVLR